MKWLDGIESKDMSLLKFMPIELVMLSNHLIFWLSLLPFPSIFPKIRAFSNELFTSGGQNIGASVTVSVLPMDTQGWFPLGLTGLISLLSKGLSSLLQHHNSKASILQLLAFSMVRLSQLYMITGKIITLTIRTLVGKVISLLFNMLSRCIITSLPRTKWSEVTVMPDSLQPHG